MNQSSDILFMAEYIKNVLYFATVRQGKSLKSTVDTHYFSIDDELVYENYYSDFGPLNLGCVYRYCRILGEKINQYLNKQIIVHYTSIEPKKKANSAFLLGCYGVLYLSLTPRDAFKPLLVRGQIYRPFQDVTQGDSAYTITIMDCLQAIKKARDLGFFNFQDFNYEEYNRLDKIHGGDLNWIIPGKFLAFIGPVDTRLSLFHPPEMYIDYFLDNNVKIVIRLNKRMYDGEVFTKAGILHYDLFFPDGSHPPRNIMFKFLQISEEADCAIAVHCKAGLGRTGSLIGSYLIKHYRMTSHEAIGWMRICRPGSVIGHQQAWLEKLEAWLIKQGNIYRKRMYQDTEKLPFHEYGIYSYAEKSARQRAFILQKTLSPPSLRPRVSNMSSSRPENSRVKEALNKAAEKERDWRLRLMSLGSFPKFACLGDQYSANSSTGSPHVSGSGDPKLPRTSRNSTPRSLRKSNNFNEPVPRGRPLSRTNQAPIIRSVDDARNYTMRNSLFSNKVENGMKTSNTAASQTFNLHRPPITAYNAAPKVQPPQNRRRLGRSPSPPRNPPTLNLNEHHKATNTPTQQGRLLKKEASRTALKDVFSRFSTLASGREGMGSMGAASLGPSRVTPAAMRPPRVRSDERPLATQGDVLNSIKFQRRCRETLVAEKAGLYDKNSPLNKKPPTTIRNIGSRSTNVNKHSLTQGATQNSSSNNSNSRDKSITTMRSFFGPQRPMSPKGRRNSQAT